jgi:hypothetical protein
VAQSERGSHNGTLDSTRRERIAFLLEHLEDVRAGVRDRGGEADHIPLMCAASNSPSYKELERLLPLLRAERPALAWHLRATYFAPRRRVLMCPRCQGVVPSWSSVNFHKHAAKNVALVPRVLRVVPVRVRPRLVAEAVGWLDERWRGEVYVPDELLPLVASA